MTRHATAGPAPRPRLTWANRITILRLLLTPLLVILLLKGERLWPLYIFLLAALSDILDGAVARWRNEQTLLGKFLDPVADKLLLSSSFLILALLGRTPMWVFIVVLFRDLLILIGWNVMFILTRVPRIEPRALGKATTFAQMATVIALLTFPGQPWPKFLTLPMIVVTVLSTIDYVWVGSQRLGELG
ncbi:MAG: CDP-alcohol phosphatidyltransferase family protein [Elusimicrobia bacterium]|nr:CDP-alcohol phosphatidyltransferase family protein [Elusimicrobiota bacterium]MBK9921679.1 CDP-alcohol phosphatidyltransferase family protein [Elusimicrobiota bacterium]MBL0249962.1 CDP-alcohol phosphatidyltransferase family protein [Elusimicrobiota bacterium]MBL0360933.1 CDP-alcohol phosphatidyltransferase family protein [Elusimicrobiota bacterium]